jgi:hypothetical protein
MATRAEQQAILCSVAYASLFDYPLTPAELRTALIGVAVADECTLERWIATTPRLSRAIERVDGFFVPRGRADLVGVRRAREAHSRALLAASRPALRSLMALPFVRTVALSGSLAHLNADEGADLDLFVIAAPGRAWLVMVAALVMARLGGWRRRLCLNYVLSERRLPVGPKDLFTANQIVHLQPVFGCETYRRFLSANPFVHRIYPNFEPRSLWAGAPLADWTWRARRGAEMLLEWTFAAAVLERCCRVLYTWHLRRRSPTWSSADQVRLEPEGLKLHTSSHRREVMRRYRTAMAEMLAAAAAGDWRPASDVGRSALRTGSRVPVEVPLREAWHGQGGSDTAA